MNYRDPERLAALTERYVLGTMSWRARRRFRRAVDEDDVIADSVFDLERRLLAMAWSLEPVQPSRLVWTRIARRTVAKPQKNRPQPGRWPAVAAALAAGLVVAVSGWWMTSLRAPETITRTETVALSPALGVFLDDNGDALWIARIYPDLGRADVIVSTPPEPRPANDYELWILRDDGVPFSLGLLPQDGERSLALSVEVIDALERGDTLAVSLEPAGGSPEPAPTGPVLYTTALLAP